MMIEGITKNNGERTKRDEAKARKRINCEIWDKRNMGRKKSGEKSTSRVRTANWTRSLDISLLQILKQEYIEGNFVNGQFTKSAWTRIVSAFNTKTKLSLTLGHVKNRLKVLRNVFRLYNEMATMSGWGWDSERHRPKPDDPSHWDRMITLNPHYAKCRDKAFPAYAILKLFFTKNVSNQTQIDAMAVDLTDKEEESSSSLRLPLNSTPKIRHQQRERITTPAPYTANKEDKDDEDEEEEEEEEEEADDVQDDISSSDLSEKNLNVTKALEELVEITRRQQEILRDILSQGLGTSGLRPCSIEQCIAKLKSVRNLSPEAFLAACEAFRDRHERRVFMSLNGPVLHAWVERRAAVMPAPPVQSVCPQNLQHFRGDHPLASAVPGMEFP